MKRLPFLPTVLVAAAVAAMVALGIWQLQRAEWKERLIARLEAARTLPPVDLNRTREAGLEYRRASISCSVSGKAEARGGRSRAGRPGFVYLLACRSPRTSRLLATLDAGWSAHSGAMKRSETAGIFTGMVRKPGRWEGISQSHYVLVLDRPLAGLEPSAQPSVEAVPNNHFLYALQWFFFAGAAALIYALALRRRQRR